ncbi:modification methylase [Candidatus Poribacteria bacterium]|nr:MAG: modification methylase [Candidatus Poribacteria bacterium]
MKTTHKILFQNARDLGEIPSESVDLVVTSPPYPMIDLWDKMFSSQNPEIQRALASNNGKKAYALMHEILDSVWDEAFRVLKNGRFACINIGDATRKVGDDFCLYPNHARILNYLLNLGFSVLPDILWRKQANTPNKFMGSGMLPAGAYVTLEHEYILILRKGSKREFKTEDEKENRRESALFWEERNIWYSDVWTDIKGREQKLPTAMPRLRSAAFPFELAYRLINMYSVKGDMILDPFLGTGTTTAAAMTSGRNSIGVEIDKSFQQVICPIVHHIVDFSNSYLSDRLQRHFAFVENRIQNAGAIKYTNKYYGCPVVTSQEQSILLNSLKEIRTSTDNIFEVIYSKKPQAWNFERPSEALDRQKMKASTKLFQPSMLDTQAQHL